MAKKQIIKNDTSSNWARASFIPQEGEIILYTDLLKIKVGDGKSAINDLAFSNKNDSPFDGIFFIEEKEAK